MMFLTAQRYKFESKSQLNKQTKDLSVRCFSLHKDTNLKANHNQPFRVEKSNPDVSHCTKIQI